MPATVRGPAAVPITIISRNLGTKRSPDSTEGESSAKLKTQIAASSRSTKAVRGISLWDTGLRKTVSFSPSEVFDNAGHAKVTRTVRFLHIGAGLQRHKMDILVADDDRMGRFLLNSTLIELGHSVTEAANGCDAWEA